MEIRKPFLGYCNLDLDNTTLEILKGKWCCLVARNSFAFSGVISSINEKTITFLDRKTGERVFQKADIFVVYETMPRMEQKNKKEEK